MNFLPRLAVAVLILSAPLAAVAADPPEFTLTLQNHQFSPAELVIPAGTKIKLMVVNKDASAEEFESHDLDREKIVTGNATIGVFVGPLRAGRYKYFGDFHQATARGLLVVR
jgi:plastocyanin